MRYNEVVERNWNRFGAERSENTRPVKPLAKTGAWAVGGDAAGKTKRVSGEHRGAYLGEDKKNDWSM